MNTVAKKSGKSKDVASAAQAEPESERVLRSAKPIEGPSESGTPEQSPALDAIDTAIEAEIAKETGRTRERYAKMGIPFRDYPRSVEEAARQRAQRVEKKALHSREADSLRSRLMRVLSAGAYVDSDLEQSSACTPERALLRYAAATTKATALALIGARYVASNEDFEVEFNDQDAAIVMCGLSELLEVGPELLTSISISDSCAPEAEAAE